MGRGRWNTQRGANNPLELTNAKLLQSTATIPKPYITTQCVINTLLLSPTHLHGNCILSFLTYLHGNCHPSFLNYLHGNCLPSFLNYLHGTSAYQPSQTISMVPLPTSLLNYPMVPLPSILLNYLHGTSA